MAEFITDVIPPAVLTGYVREMVNGDLVFAGLFPPRLVDDIEYEATRQDRFVGEVARYRSWDTAVKIGKRPGVSIIRGEIPPLGWGYFLDEKDVLRFEKIRAGIRDQFSADVEQAIFNDAVNAARAVQDRINWATSELLQTGKVKLTEIGDPVSGNELVADYAVPPAQLGVAPLTLWSDHTTSTPITNMLAWRTIFRGNNGGQNPDAWLTSGTVFGDLQLNKEVRDEFVAGSGVNVPHILNEENLRAVLRSRGITEPIVVIDDERAAFANDQTTARLLAENKFIGVRSSVLGETLYGITPDAAVLSGNGELQFTDTPGIIAFQERWISPAAARTTAETVALPRLKDPSALFVATVR